jgi:undecaprenyl diphosphate synthase
MTKDSVSPDTQSPHRDSLRHIAIIMDGNNRWAKQRGLPGAAGHKRGVERVRDILEACRHIGIDVLTLFAFSSENWNRPKMEVSGLMTLFSIYLKKETAKLKSEGVRIRVIGARDKFSKKLSEQIEWAEQETAAGTMTLVLAVDYGGRWDITQAAKTIAEKIQRGELTAQQVNEDLFGQHVCIGNLAPVDLLIRTSGELRISNFLLWQCAYAEFYFTDVYWPDFDEAQLHRAIAEFRSRQRRFGLRIENNLKAGSSDSDESFPINALEDDNSYV